MAHLFKKASQEKGLIVFTHKEWGYFSAIKGIRTLKRQGKLPRWMQQEELRQPFRSSIEELKQRYFIGVHFGWYQPHPFRSKLVDFVVSGESTLPHLGENIFRIPFNSRNFVPKAFENRQAEKIWDIITVGRNVNFKNYRKMFAALKCLLQRRPQTTALLIVPSQSKMPYGVHRNLADDFYRSTTDAEQKNIAFLFLHPSLQYGMHQHQLIEFYNRSRVFTLFSEEEGESRVVSEALCCGLPTVVYSNLRGGGRDLLDDTNSCLFDDFEQADEALEKALDRFADGLTIDQAPKTREDYTLAHLHDYFETLYSNHGATFDGDLINTDHLDLRLPAHYYDVPWQSNKRKPTADILSKAQFDTFLAAL